MFLSKTIASESNIVIITFREKNEKFPSKDFEIIFWKNHISANIDLRSAIYASNKI